MANKDAPRGFIPVGHLTGGAIRTNEYVMTASATVYKGDLVKRVSAGTVEKGAATIGTAAIGVAAEYKVASATAGATKLKVYDDPDIIYMAQVSSSGTDLTSAVIGAITDSINTHAGSATTGLSGDELANTTGQAQFQILDIYHSPDNEWGDHVKLLVRLNEHAYGYTGVAV